MAHFGTRCPDGNALTGTTSTSTSMRRSAPVMVEPISSAQRKLCDAVLAASRRHRIVLWGTHTHTHSTAHSLANNCIKLFRVTIYATSPIRASRSAFGCETAPASTIVTAENRVYTRPPGFGTGAPAAGRTCHAFVNDSKYAFVCSFIRSVRRSAETPVLGHAMRSNATANGQRGAQTGRRQQRASKNNTCIRPRPHAHGAVPSGNVAAVVDTWTTVGATSGTSGIARSHWANANCQHRCGTAL